MEENIVACYRHFDRLGCPHVKLRRIDDMSLCAATMEAMAVGKDLIVMDTTKGYAHDVAASDLAEVLGVLPDSCLIDAGDPSTPTMWGAIYTLREHGRDTAVRYASLLARH
jgi:hypothetical protein